MAPTRKQRKQMLLEKGGLPTPSKAVQKAGVPTPAKLMERASIPAGYISPGNSPFLKKLPREIRDKIYDELLIVQRTPEDQDKYNKIQAGLATGTHEYELERELDYLSQDYLLIPDLSRANKGMLFIGKNKGVLLANKQIYDEATTTLFGKNEFGAAPQSERIETFWRCGIGAVCIPHNRPCHARPETFAKIKHLYIIVSVSQPDGTLTNRHTVAGNVKANLQTIVDTLQESGNHLLNFTLRYWSHFGGEFESVRDSLEGPLPRGMAQRPPAMIRNAITGKFHQITASDMHTTIFRDIRILEPLKTLKGFADYVNVRGDLPAGYRDEMKVILSATDPGVPGKKMRKAEAEAASKKIKPIGGLAGFAAKMLADDPNMDPGLKASYEELTKISTKSPAVMSQIFPELYGGAPMDSFPMPMGPPIDVPTPTGGIGILDGKPIFGPVKPPVVGEQAVMQ